MDEKALIRAGLTEKQAKLYLACLELGQAKIPAIAHRAGVKRATAYGVIDELVSLGLLSISAKGNARMFQPQDPQRLVELLEAKKNEAVRVLPDLRALLAHRSLRPQVQFFEGRAGVRQIYDDVLTCRSKKVQQIVRVRDHMEFLGEYSEEYIKKRVARGIVAYDLHPKSGDVYTATRGRENVHLKRFRSVPPAGCLLRFNHYDL